MLFGSAVVGTVVTGGDGMVLPPVDAIGETTTDVFTALLRLTPLVFSC